MKQRPIYRITIHSGWSTIAGVASVLLICIASAILEMRYLLEGHIVRVSWGTILIALSSPVAAVIYREMHLKLALALIGIEASVRITLSYVHASYAARHVAAAAGHALKFVGLLIVTFAIVKWFRSVIRRIPVAEPEGPNS
jgi:hypothetical protein